MSHEVKEFARRLGLAQQEVAHNKKLAEEITSQYEKLQRLHREVAEVLDLRLRRNTAALQCIKELTDKFEGEDSIPRKVVQLGLLDIALILSGCKDSELPK